MQIQAEGEASSSASSYSSGSGSGSWTYLYHVFLSFRGEDTRKGFADHLRVSLQRKGITFFRDDKDLERGEVISQELLKAIEESMFAIIILSPNYASSTWCLDELQMIVECKNKQGLQVFPIFYGVDPSNVRHKKYSFEEAFKIHELKFGKGSYKVENWRNALRQVAGYSGWDSNNQPEAMLVDDVAQHILKKLIPKLPSCNENLVGIDSRVEEVNRLIGIWLNDVRLIGIWGMGGIGKTTIARAVYEAIKENFEISCFVPNVREVYEKNGLVQLQKDLLSRLNINSCDIHDLYDGKKTIRNSLCNRKVLLVLDDVSHRSQLENLAAKKDWFGAGSRVIITTRDMHLLLIHGVYGTYEVEGLVQTDSLHLFSLKAFKQTQPDQCYMDLSKEVVKYAKGLPLALEVLGSYLYRRSVDVWHSALEQIKSQSHPEILDTLKISYEGLNAMEKNLFLDIACFFKGMKRNKVIKILQNSGHYPIIGIEVLIERSLVTIEWWSDNLEMHDLIQEMGRNIVFQESPNDPGKRSRLWSRDEIDTVFTESKGTEVIQGIVLNLLQPHVASWSTEAFSNTKQLKYLVLDDLKLQFGLNFLPSSLKVLHWRGCSLKTLPLMDRSYELSDIKLSHSEIEQVWHGEKFLEMLKHLDLSFSKNLKRLPDFSGVPNIETLDLGFCSSLAEVHPSLVHHKKLVTLYLDYCTSLKALPSKLEMSSLKELHLDGCSEFKILPGFGESMKHLLVLSLKGTAIRKLSTTLGCLVGLEVLNLKNCKLFVSLPDSMQRLCSLKKLVLSGCSKFRNLPEFGEGMKYLSKLYLDGTGIRELPTSLGCLVGLVRLDLSYCKKLVGLPDAIGRLKSLKYLYIYEAWKLGKLSFSGNERLGFKSQPTHIRLGFPPSLLNLPSLISLHLSYCNLSEKSIPHDISNLTSLKKLWMKGNKFVTLPINISKLSKLELLSLTHCTMLRCLPELPSSIRGLFASDCYSLETSNFNLCSLFASCGQCPPKVADSFDMVITRSEIPSWFIHQEDGEYVSVPRNCPLNDRVGIALCFLLISYADPYEGFNYVVKCCLGSPLGKCIRETRLSRMESGYAHLYILFLADPQSWGQICLGSRFGLFQKAKDFTDDDKCGHPDLLDLKVVSCGSRWLYKKDIQVLNNTITTKQLQPNSEILELTT
ncbi:TMV resistance protein N-like [Abrus precatorius]|uniref:TMV resistance protein N-like n=1 Tax=Abrus precatorius TaxID=3816 RepID=A0A8B8L277_ABRPR|nr:TMV resistance protein N-like [Abrus precatorius]